MESKQLLRKKILEIIYKSGASHIGSSFSVVEILSAVYRSVDIKKIKNKQDDRDRVILSKGHSAAALYVILNHFGLMTNEELKTYYTNGSLLMGHASHNIPYVEHSTGALGHGLSVATGIALGMKTRKINSRVFVITGDGEMNEGSNWEALMLAGHLKLNNLCILIDNNGLGGIGDANCYLNPLKAKLESFNLEVYGVDGHNEEEICSIIQKDSDKPKTIICNTIKGKGVSFMENNNVWHYKPPNKEEYENAKRELKMKLIKANENGTI